MICFNIICMLILLGLCSCLSMAVDELKPVHVDMWKEHNRYRSTGINSNTRVHQDNDKMKNTVETKVPSLMTDLLPTVGDKLKRMERIPRGIKASINAISDTHLQAVAGINCVVCTCPSKNSYNPEKCKSCCGDQQNSSTEEPKDKVDSDDNLPVTARVNCSTCSCSIETSSNEGECKLCCRHDDEQPNDGRVEETELILDDSSNYNQQAQSINCVLCHCPAERSYNPEKCKYCCSDVNLDTKVDKLEPVITGNSGVTPVVNCEICSCPVEKGSSVEECKFCCPYEKHDSKLDKVEFAINVDLLTKPAVDCAVCHCQGYDVENCNLCCHESQNTEVEMTNRIIKPDSISNSKAFSGVNCGARLLLISISALLTCF